MCVCVCVCVSPSLSLNASLNVHLHQLPQGNAAENVDCELTGDVAPPPADGLRQTLTDPLNQHVPASTRLVSHRPTSPWFSLVGPQILESKRQRRRAERQWIKSGLTVCLFVGCLTSQQHASVSQGRICTDNFTSCHTEIEAADQTFHLTQSQYTDTGPTSPSADPITPGAWQGSHWSANF